ncbi:MAG: hypothetical protein QG673_45, partial [Pseudomonadota bacterium]|nr:hypothetical protein [Pseudomonadota bacterium]
ARGHMGGRPTLLDNRQVKRMIEMYNSKKILLVKSVKSMKLVDLHFIII